MRCISRLVGAPTAGADRRGPGWRPQPPTGNAWWPDCPRKTRAAPPSPTALRTLEREREIPGASQGPARATKHVGVTDVVSLHHQVYPRLPNRLSRRDRLDRSAVCAEARPERTV